jgi:hypothetical protein
MQITVTRRQNVWPIFAPVFNARAIYYSTYGLEGYKYAGELISASVLISVLRLNDYIGVYILRVQI